MKLMKCISKVQTAKRDEAVGNQFLAIDWGEHLPKRKKYPFKADKYTIDSCDLLCADSQC